MPDPALSTAAGPDQFTSPLVGEVARRSPKGEGEREGSEQQIPRLSLTPLPRPQGGRGKKHARARATIRQAFTIGAKALREAGIETPELDARLLLCHAADLTHETFIARGGDRLSAEAQARFEAALARRLAREPVSRIAGRREFYGRAFLVGPETLDPRADTETVIEAALALAEARGGRHHPLDVLDLGTGTGCILITLLAELPNARGIGTDVSLGALALAAENARRLGVAARANFVAADWLDGIGGQFDMILSNPPYIPSVEIETLAAEVACYDPRLALDGGRDGLSAYRKIAARVGDLLAPEGKLLVELGACQANDVASIFRAAGLRPVAVAKDLGGRSRVLVAER